MFDDEFELIIVIVTETQAPYPFRFIAVSRNMPSCLYFPGQLAQNKLHVIFYKTFLAGVWRNGCTHTVLVALSTGLFLSRQPSRIPEQCGWHAKSYMWETCSFQVIYFEDQAKGFNPKENNKKWKKKKRHENMLLDGKILPQRLSKWVNS